MEHEVRDNEKSLMIFCISMLFFVKNKMTCPNILPLPNDYKQM